MRRDKPDHVISWMLGGAHVVAAKEMKRNGIPMEKYISVNWLNEVDIANIGVEAGWRELGSADRLDLGIQRHRVGRGQGKFLEI